MAKQNIYDNEAFFENFQEIRKNEINYNDLIETPIFMSLLPDLSGKHVLDIGCGMGQHAKQYADMGAKTVLGIDLSEKMLDVAKREYSADNITYQKMAMEDIGQIDRKFDVVTSSLAFDYAEHLDELANAVYRMMESDGIFVFSMSHPIATAFDGEYPRWTRAENGERLYLNLRNYCVEGLRKITWVVDGYELYHRMFSSIINAIAHAGFLIEDCRESQTTKELREKEPEKFEGTVHYPDFLFLKCRKIRPS